MKSKIKSVGHVILKVILYLFIPLIISYGFYELSNYGEYVGNLWITCISATISISIITTICFFIIVFFFALLFDL